MTENQKKIIVTIIKKYKINYDIDGFVNAIKESTKDELVRPFLLANKLNISRKSGYKIMEELVDNKMALAQLLFVCPHCKTENGVYKTISDVPANVICKHCNTKTNDVFANTFVMYEITF